MAGLLQYVAGGVLSEVGDGLQNDAKAKRAAALQSLENEGALAAKDREHGYRVTEKAAEAAANSGLLQSTIQDADGRFYGVTKSGDKIPLGVTGRAPGARSADEEGGISNGDARLLARVEAGYKMQDGTVDKGAIAEHLHNIGRDDLAKVYSTGERGGVNVNDPLWTEAGDRADAETKAKAGYFSTDKSDFAESGGNRETFRTKRQQEIYDEMKGRKPASAANDRAEKNEPKAKDARAAGAMQGGGTQDEPYQAQTQQDVEWFKTSAPAGAVIMINGKLYTK